MTMLTGTRRALLGGQKLRPYNFDLALTTFTASMAKRAGTVFAANVACQGNWDGSGVPDVLSFPRGDLVANPTGYWYGNIDQYQGSVVFWVTPEWDGNDGITHYMFADSSGFFRIFKAADNGLYFDCLGTLFSVDISGWTAGTTYSVVARWDRKNTLDGTNYLSLSINDVHAFGGTSVPTQDLPATLFIGSLNGTTSPANAIIEGLTIYRRPLWDGAYGVDVGNGDEIALISAGSDPCLITGSYDVVFCMPTDSTPGALVTGTGEAWSHPHSSAVLNHSFLEDGYYGQPWAVYFDGTGDDVNFGSDATIDDIPSGQSITIEGWFRIDALDAERRFLIGKTSTASNGWRLRLVADGQLNAFINCAPTNASSIATPASFGLLTFADGKWHHFAMVYDDTGDKTIYLSIDGVWASSYSTQTASVGAYVSDAAASLYTGEQAGTGFDFQGAHGWLRLSDNRRYTPGTDFVPPRDLPAADGNTIEQWTVAQGTGNLTAVVTAPNNDGVRTGAVWEAQWEDEGTPVIPYSLEFFEENDGIDFGSGANIDDLFSADCTIEFWIYVPSNVTNNTDLMSKTNVGRTIGWTARPLTAGPTVNFIAKFATNDLNANATISYGRWHHIALDWDVGTLTGRAFTDGVLISSGTAVGAYQADAAQDCLVNARGAIGSLDTSFTIGPIRLSNSRRYTGNSFIPPSRNNWPANDANAQLITTMRDGAGATVTDYSGNAYHGTITFGATTRWNTSPDMSVDSPGRQITPWGYSFGADSDGDAIVQKLTGLAAGSNYVARYLMNTEPGTSEPSIIVSDLTNNAIVTTVPAPRTIGYHTGANDAATLSDSGARWPQSLVGATVYNVMDGSSGAITAISGDMKEITASLAGGTDNDWDTGDTYMIVPHSKWVWAEPFCWGLPTIARNGSAADCVAMATLIRSPGNGMWHLHQAEVQVNLIDNPSLEAVYAGVPPIPPGWTNLGLDAGDTQAEAVIIHSGAESMRWNVGAVSGEVLYQALSAAVGDFFGIGVWIYGDGGVGLKYGQRVNVRGTFQYDAITSELNTPSAASWNIATGVLRIDHVAPQPQIEGLSAAGGNRYTDDFWAIVLDPITLTATAANYANSLESGGIRIDGRDSCTQPIPAGILKATKGRIRFKKTPRHSAGDFLKFGENATTVSWFSIYKDANNLIRMFSATATTISLRVVAGGVTSSASWDATGEIVAGTTYSMEIRYSATSVRFYMDGALKITVAPALGINFGANVPDIAHWGSRFDDIHQVDAVYGNP